MPVRHHPLLIVVGSLLALAGCGERVQQPASVAPPIPAAAQPPAQGALTTISEADGRTLVELPLGSDHGLEPGIFLRVYAADDPHRLKGMVQVTEVLAKDRAIARQIALGDRQDPLKPGDQARVVADLTAIADPQAVEAAVKVNTSQQQQPAQANQAEHAVLRDQYQRELAAAQARYEQQLADIRRQYEAQLKAGDISHALILQRRELELRTDLAAVKASVNEQVAAGIATERKASAERITALDTAKTNLERQVEQLLAQQQESAGRITTLVTQLADKDRHHGEELRAEVESRELIAKRVNELESRLNGKPTTGAAVLSAEPGRGETVLERLSRLTGELASERERAKKLDASLATADQDLAVAKQAHASLQRRYEALGQADQRAQDLAAKLKDNEDRLATSERQRAALELSRLEAERQLYDLAARVLRLAGGAPDTSALQARLRDVMSPATNPGKGEP